jgi:hypothetical protein
VRWKGELEKVAKASTTAPCMRFEVNCFDMLRI